MTLLLVLLTVVLLFIVLLFAVKSRINLVFDSANSDMHLTLFWLYPLLKSEIARKDGGFVMTLYLLNKRILTRQIKRKLGVSGNKGVLRSLRPTDIHVDTRFGFRDPFVTGLACSAVTMISEFLNVESLHQKPDFLAINDYISLDATAKLNLGRSLAKLI
ncbi:MAG TPA: hypothetical protein VEG39_07575 [Clostridia bacterium]|nr:hypothetical protein [Clostridia bacterium]